MYSQRRRLHSQNFLRSPELVKKLIRNSSIGKSDTVLEIGPGKGIITNELLKSADRVIAVELDYKLYRYLKFKFRNFESLELYQVNFLNFGLPNYPYKVFANIPFVITAEVIRRLTNDKNFQEGYLIVQKEAAKRFIGKPYDRKNQMVSMLLKPWFNIQVFHEFSRKDFYPEPNINTTMIRIIRVKTPLVSWSIQKDYRNFILYLYNREKVARLDFEKMLKKFQQYQKYSTANDKSRLDREAAKILKAQEKIKKIHRTRKDRNWRKY